MLSNTTRTTLSRSSGAIRSQAFAFSSRATEPTHYLITLKRSAIGLPPASKATLEALGLHRLGQSVLHPFGAAAAGKILRVKELVQVRNVEEEEGRKLAVRRRQEGSGLEVAGRAFGGGRGEMSL